MSGCRGFGSACGRGVVSARGLLRDRAAVLWFCRGILRVGRARLRRAWRAATLIATTAGLAAWLTTPTIVALLTEPLP